MLEDNGYEIKILNTINFKKYMKYNPFAYICSEKDILKLVQTIIANTKGEGEKAGEDFWVKAENSITQHLLATSSMKLQGKKREQLKQEKLKTLKKAEYH